MKVSEQIKELTELLQEYGDLDLVYSSDPEGNSFDKVYYGPSVGMITDEKEYFDLSQFEEYINDGWQKEDLVVNCICIN